MESLQPFRLETKNRLFQEKIFCLLGTIAFGDICVLMLTFPNAKHLPLGRSRARNRAPLLRGGDSPKRLPQHWRVWRSESFCSGKEGNQSQSGSPRRDAAPQATANRMKLRQCSNGEALAVAFFNSKPGEADCL